MILFRPIIHTIICSACCLIVSVRCTQMNSALFTHQHISAKDTWRQFDKVKIPNPLQANTHFNEQFCSINNHSHTSSENIHLLQTLLKENVLYFRPFVVILIFMKLDGVLFPPAFSKRRSPGSVIVYFLCCLKSNRSTWFLRVSPSIFASGTNQQLRLRTEISTDTALLSAIKLSRTLKCDDQSGFFFRSHLAWLDGNPWTFWSERL